MKTTWICAAAMGTACMGTEVVLQPKGSTGAESSATTPGVEITTTPTTPTTPQGTGDELGPCQALYLRDDEMDGTIERSGIATYDPADPGRLLTFVLDVDNDGTDDMMDTNDYDGSGQRVRWETVRLKDGRVDGVYEWEYDAEGRVTAYRTDYWFSADGVWDTDEAYTYDAAGFLATVVGYGTTGTRFRNTFTNDPVKGDVLTEARDVGDDGTVDTLYTHTYDDAGRIERIEGDSDGDGVADLGVQSWVYDDPTLKVGTQLWDHDADGAVDMRELFEYDPVLDLQTYWAIDNSGGTSWDIEQTVVWDPALRVPLSIDYFDGIGMPVHTWRSEFVYDDWGRSVSHLYTDELPGESYVETWAATDCP